MSSEPVQIAAEVIGLVPGDAADVRRVVGQVAVATTPGQVAAVALEPAEPPACADWVVLGPGSWFTSVLPNLLVPDLRAALERTPARRLVVLNLAPQTGETSGFSPEAHLEVLAAHAPDLPVDVVLADEGAVSDTGSLAAAAEAAGARLVLAPVALGDGTPRHSPVLLAEAYRRVMVPA
jgi:uncharacterized cofD-like protein